MHEAPRRPAGGPQPQAVPVLARLIPQAHSSPCILFWFSPFARLRRALSLAARFDAAAVLRLPGLRRGLRHTRALTRKMELGDKAVGFLLTLTSLSIFTYYTFWVIILPFVDSDHFVHKYFLPQDYAILIPVFAGVVLLSFLSVFVVILGKILNPKTSAIMGQREYFMM
ncbi:hypothetical protein U9M48_020076, partial [Paspalum notatum var. saurae]